MALLDEVSGSESIAIGITTGKALVGHIEECKVLLLLDHVADLAPLLLSRVDTGGVVCASVEQDDAVLGSSLQVGNETIKIQTDGVLVVVTVRRDLEAGVVEDSAVVGPAGSGNIDLLGVGIESREECRADPQGTGTGDGLSNDKTVVLDGGRIGTVGKLSSSLGEGRDTRDAGIFLVEVRRDDLVLRSTNRRQDVRLTLVIT